MHFLKAHFFTWVRSGRANLFEWPNLPIKLSAEVKKCVCSLGNKCVRPCLLEYCRLSVLFWLYDVNAHEKMCVFVKKYGVPVSHLI